MREIARRVEEEQARDPIALEVPGVNYVIIATPPGFKPTQFKAAVEAGKITPERYESYLRLREELEEQYVY